MDECGVDSDNDSDAGDRDRRRHVVSVIGKLFAEVAEHLRGKDPTQ